MLDVGKRGRSPRKREFRRRCYLPKQRHSGTVGGSKDFAGFWITAVRELESFEHTDQMHLQKMDE